MTPQSSAPLSFSITFTLNPGTYDATIVPGSLTVNPERPRRRVNSGHLRQRLYSNKNSRSRPSRSRSRSPRGQRYDETRERRSDRERSYGDRHNHSDMEDRGVEDHERSGHRRPSTKRSQLHYQEVSTPPHRSRHLDQESIEDHGVEDYEARLFEKLQKAIKKVNVLSDLWLSHKSTRDQSSKHYPKIAHLPGCDHYHGRAKSPGEHEDRWTEAHCEGGDHSDRDEYARDPPAKRRNVVAERDSRNGVYQSLSRSPVKRYSNDAKDDEDFCSPPPAKRRKFSERDSVSCNDDSSRGRSLSSANRRDYAAVSRSPAKRHTQDEDDSACSSAPARHIQHSSETREDCPIHNHRVNAGQTRRDGGGDPTPARKRVRPGYWYRKVAVGLTSESGEDD